MSIAHTIMGNLNTYGGSKKKRLQEYIETQQLDDIGREEHTHVWGNHRCRVLTNGTGKPWFFKEGWEFNSDHTIVAAKVKTEVTVVDSTETDWDKGRQWLENEEENPEESKAWKIVGDPYEEVREFSKAWIRTMRICRRSKQWWKNEWKPLRKKQESARRPGKSSTRKSGRPRE